jgi:hypothetical protein
MEDDMWVHCGKEKCTAKVAHLFQQQSQHRHSRLKKHGGSLGHLE